MYRVHTGGKRYYTFETLKAACKFCHDVFERTGYVLSIVKA